MADKRGRRPLVEGDRAVPISFSLPSKQYDDLCREARREHVHLAEMVRRKIRRGERTEEDDDDD